MTDLTERVMRKFNKLVAGTDDLQQVIRKAIVSICEELETSDRPIKINKLIIHVNAPRGGGATVNLREGR